MNRRFCRIKDCGEITLRDCLCERHWTERDEKQKANSKAYHKEYHERKKKLVGRKTPNEDMKKRVGAILSSAIYDERVTR